MQRKQDDAMMASGNGAGASGHGVAQTIDARGLSCPQPVVLTRNALGNIESGRLDVLVDNVVAKENVMRFARHEGCIVDVNDTEENCYVIHIDKQSRR
ncbi:MAG: sulfurtransferase TusA family protein [Clostridia bacterium]|nr:sulfurtransferase TusA family protein [Clostridia bacterium]